MTQPEIRGAASLISVGVLLLGASGIFAQLQDALNTVWKVKPQPGQGMLLFIRKRVSSFFMVLAIGLILILSLILSAVVSTLSRYKVDFLPGSAILWENLDFIVSLGLMTFIFCLMFKYVPRCQNSLERCGCRFGNYGGTVSVRQVSFRTLSWRWQSGIGLWCGGFFDRPASLDLLFCSNYPLRRRIYSGLYPYVWLKNKTIQTFSN